MAKRNCYSLIIEEIFKRNFKSKSERVPFQREDITTIANALGVKLPKNLGDVIYSFRYRATLPESITKLATEGMEWIIRPEGSARYAFTLVKLPRILPNINLAETKIPDATPGVITKYALNDEQGLLAKLRYNRLIDIFTGVTCYSLQNHLRTHIAGVGQIETDELYVGIDTKGAHYIFPVQAKGGTDKLGIVQIEQDFAMCDKKFPNLVCIPIAAQFIEDSSIALFSFEREDGVVKITVEKHYRLVAPEEITDEDLLKYQHRAPF